MAQSEETVKVWTSHPSRGRVGASPPLPINEPDGGGALLYDVEER